MERRSLVNIFGLVVGFVTATSCVIGGFYVLLDYALGPVVQYGTTLSWSQTLATITSVTPTEHGYFCHVKYNYTVENSTYAGNRTRTQHVNPYRARRHKCALYTADNTTMVWYDSKRPNRAALERTFFGDLWLSVNILDSLALVALGGGALFWIFKKEEPFAALCLAQTTTAFVAAVPISIIRLFHGHALATFPLLAGFACAAVAGYCALILAGGRRARRTLGAKDIEDWWTSTGEDDQQKDFAVPETATANA